MYHAKLAYLVIVSVHSKAGTSLFNIAKYDLVTAAWGFSLVGLLRARHNTITTRLPTLHHTCVCVFLLEDPANPVTLVYTNTIVCDE